MRIQLGIAACAIAAAAADQPVHNRLTPEERAAGWRLLFDGKTLHGWEDPAKEKPPGNAWVVADGCIKSVRDPRIREDLLTKASFGDFELAFDWRIQEGGNSGVKYRIQDRVCVIPSRTAQIKKFEDKVEFEFRNRASKREAATQGDHFEEYLVAFEYQVIDDERHADAKRGLDRASGSVYSMIAPNTRAARPAGEFNQSRILLKGDRVEHWLNGQKVIDARLDAPEIADKLALRWGKESAVYNLLTKQPKKRTPLALQHHQDEVWFRNVKIRPR